MAFKYDDYKESDAVRLARENADKYKSYKESDDVRLSRDRMNEHETKRVGDWTGGTYGQSLRDTMDRIGNREKFSYDLNADALYQQYKDKYINQGKMAMADTMGQAAALTGGYGNSYATSVGQQAYQQSLDNLNDVIPQLYQMALDRYNQEGTDLYRQLDMYNQAYGTEYGEYRDRVSDWNAEAARLSDAYYNAANMDWNKYINNRDFAYNAFRDTRDTDYGRYTDAYNRAFTGYQQSVSEDQFAKELALKQAQLAETIRANKADEAYKLKALSKSGSGGSGGSRKSSGGSKKGSGSGNDKKKEDAKTPANATPFYPYSDPVAPKAMTIPEQIKFIQDTLYKKKL